MPEVLRPRVLVTDDREENRYVLSRVLDAAGFECIEAGTGRATLEAAQALPDVIILDVRLPDMSGYEVCRRIKGDPRTSSISVLQISASFVSNDDRVRALDAGADGYLTHPIDRMVLVATVRALLRLRKAESAARQSAAQWQSTFDALSEGLCLVDGDGRLVRWNNAFAEICAPNQAIVAGEDAATFLKAVLGSDEPMASNNHRYSGEFAIGKRTFQLSVNLIQADGNRQERIVILNDVTDRKLAEYALRTAEKLAATGKLANAIAHEINNPLEALTNLIYLASSSSSLESIHGFLERANEELGRIARVTKQSLAFDRDSELPMLIDVGSLVSEVISLFERAAAQRRVRLAYSGQKDVNICGFPGQLTQIFGNLVRNATEAAPPGSAVAIRVRSIHRGGKKGARVTIHDCGPGIPEAIREKLFDPFFTTKDLKGSGLGLWVSKTLVVKHQGTIRYRSSHAEGTSGTTFEVYLPAGTSEEAR
jgi:two-component system NtrC family sensor kinase